MNSAYSASSLKLFRDKLKMLENEKENTIRVLNEKILRGRDVILLSGKYKNRRAQIRSYYFHFGEEYIHVYIYRLDERTGFKGKEQFIDDHKNEYVRWSDCELV